MSHQFKPGDLALIIGSSRGTSPNIGMAVELVEKVAHQSEICIPDGRKMLNRGPDSWLVSAQGLVAQLLSGDRVDLGGITLVEERHLVPLRGAFTPQQQKSKAVSS
jgi:hypothetical protein